MRDGTGLDLREADSRAGTFVVRVVDFSKPRPGGLVGDGKFVLILESGAARCLALVEAGTFEIGGFAGVFWDLADRLVVLLCFAGWEWSVCGWVADLVLKIGGRGNLVSLKCATIALWPEICLLTTSAARLSLCGVGEPDDDDGESGGESVALR